MRLGTSYLILVICFSNGWNSWKTKARTCGRGFYLGKNMTCFDDNECGETEAESWALCGTNTECHNTLGSFYCTCKKGYAIESGETNFTTMTHCRDIDECETDPCGPNATCTNKFGHFVCTCNEGFVSTTGEHTFTDKTVTQCQDIDECVTDPCGSNTTCTNTFGHFVCTCNEGFVSTTGKHTFTDKAITQCQDDNECGETEAESWALCGTNTECHNTLGSFYCTCKKGYASESGVTNFTTLTHCRDNDECETEPCGSNATCTNKFGDFECTCNEGFVSTTGERTFTNKTVTQCQDINECVTDPCGSNATCTNTFGGFECTCNEGLVSTTGERTFTDKTVTQCQELNRINTEQCSLNNFTKVGKISLTTYHLFCSWINSTINQITHQNVQEIISNSSDILRNYSLWENMEKEQRLYSCSIFLQTMENAAIVAALNLPPQGNRTISTENINMEVRAFQGGNRSALDRIRLQVKDTVMDINRQTHSRGNTTDLTVMALIAYKGMDSILNGSGFHSTTGGKQKPFQLISDVVSAVITNRHNNGLDPIVNITFKHTQQANSEWTTHCVHWDYAAGKSYWSPRGCNMGDSSETHIQCQCNHLSTLALLMSPVGLQDYPFALTTITLIGIPISLLCLGITIVTFAFCTNVRNALHITHMQLCVSLFLAELLFLLGINRTTNRVMCGIIAGFLHYLFLAAFVWMFLEGVQLFLMVRNIRNLRVPHSEKVEKSMYLLGYGVPAAIVVISAAVYHDGYGSPRHCWVSTNRGFIWSFLGPVCLIIGINTALYFTILLILKREVSKRDTKVSKLQNTRMLTFKAIAQVFILGCTWIFGLFQFQEQPGVMTYLFTIINSFQGTFIFILLCMLNPKVRTAYSNYFTSKCKAKDTKPSEEDKANTMTVLSVSKD
ncbi:adhesion G protein-coupled receptor E1-like isoform X3 [Chiloscyllium plagiosum]|uniref:adhesion G protein-coupled receptor E1-like isoform X3 n=1 Tax=Chiloscyllium plagiosum TaxID=36176 RepID=UPI001CB7B26F|nr:adhesion G protein-coupled receptor E1-like isoform X3 [Chiloscyllium plagiosum]